MIALDKPVLKTPRLILRPWRESDLAPFAAMGADPRVMRHYPKLLTREETDAAVERMQNHFAQHGFGAFAVELSATKDFLGFVGLTIRGPLYALRRNWLAHSQRIPVPGVCHGGSSGGAAIWI